MAAEVTSEAVVLRRINSGESDRRLTLLTLEFGKIDVVAKGARKSGSRLAGSSEPLVRAKFTWSSGRARRFVTQVQPLSSFPEIRSNYDKMIAALALAELAAVSLPYESPQSDQDGLYDLFLRSLNAIESAAEWKAAMVWCESKLMDAEGVHPDWTACAITGSKLAENPAWVSAKAGGYVSTPVAQGYDDKLLISAEALITLQKVVELEEPPAKALYADECLRTLFVFWRHTLENRLPANESMVQGLTRSNDLA